MLPPPAFHRQLALVTLLVAAGLGVLYLAVADLQGRVAYLAMLLAGFAAFTWQAQFIAEGLARHDNPATLLNFVLALTGAKMFLALALVYGYKVYTRPEGLDYLWPFGWVYLAFTSFETYALVRLSFATAPKKPSRRGQDDLRDDPH